MRLYLALNRRNLTRSDGIPVVSVVIAARNEVSVIGQLLESLINQDYAAERSEFIIIDDGSNDGTAEVVGEYIKKDSRFRLITLADDPTRSMGPKKRALSAGIEVSQGEIIITTDADCEVQPGWIRSMVSLFSDDVQAVCGRVRFRRSRGFWGKLAAFESIVNAILNASVIKTGGALSCAGANFAYRRSIFTSVGGYDKSRKSVSGDDDLLLQKIKSKKGAIRFNNASDSVVSTSGPANAEQYWSRKRRHLSAGRRYAWYWILLAGIIYTGFVLTLILILADILGMNQTPDQLPVWLIYTFSLYLVFLKGLIYLDERKWYFWGFIASLLFPLIFTIIQPLTLLPAPSWKGRKS